ALLSITKADQWDDFTNNFVTDLTPPIALFGEQVTKQFLSESTSTWNNVIFSLLPLGILIAVVSAIRVCGSPSLKVFIGRAQESPGNAEIELLSCTSDGVGNVWNDGGIARVLGRPGVLEVVRFEVEENEYYEGKDRCDKFSSAGIDLLEQAKEVRGNDLEAELQILHSPNLSLNIGIKRPNPWYFHTAVFIGAVLQIGVLVFAELANYQFPAQFRKDRKLMAALAFPITLLSTVMVSITGKGCVVGVNSTKKEYHEKSRGKSKMYWCQTDGQKLRDQVFNAFIGCCEDEKYVEVGVKNTWWSDDVLLWAAVFITMSGFVVQFVGLRAMHSSIFVAQLGSTMIMAVIRASLRTQRMDGGTNLL
ncbi:hypothetical protein BDZ45DRAFT_606723, partial [Acephala macrosclerotiorum]